MDNNLNLMENVAIPYILVDYGVSASKFALWQGLFGLITFAVFFIAWLSDAFGRRKGTLVLMLTMGIPALLVLFLTENFFFFMLLYALIITGTLSNMWEIPVTEESPPDKRGLYGGIATLISLIPIYAFIGIGIAQGLGWRWTYAIFFFFMLGLLVMWFFMKEPERWERSKEDRGHEFLKIKHALKKISRKDAVYIAISTIVYGIWTVSFKMGSSWGGYYFTTVQGLTEDEFGDILLVGGLCIMFGALVSGIIMDKLGRITTLILGCGGAIFGFIFLGLTGSPIGFWLMYFFMPVVFTWIMVYFAEVYPTEIRSTATGIAATGARVSYVAGPLLSSVLLLAFPTMELFWIIGGLFMIIPLFSLLLKPYETKGKSLEDIQKER